MVLGFGEGKIEITTEKQAYSPGGLLKGKIMLELDSPKKARAFRIHFYGERKTSRTTYSSGGTHSSNSTERVMQQELSLDGEREYSGRKDYDFQFQLPTFQKPQMMEGGGLVAGIVNTFASFADPYANVSWHLDASLDVPMSLDVNRKIRVNFVR